MKTLLLPLVLSLTACQAAIITVGSGNVVTTTREVGAFRKVSVASAITVHATVGSRAVTVRTDDNLQPLLETFLDGDTLVIRIKPTHNASLPTALEATLSNDVLEGVAVSGASHVTLAATPVATFPLTASGASALEVSGLSSTTLTLDVSGASNVTVAGEAMVGTATVSGASTAHLREVSLSSLALDVSGASTVTARVSSMLTGSVSGASTVTISGTPANQVTSTGASQVTVGAP